MTTTVTAADNAPKVLISQSGRKGDPGTNGTNGDGFNQVRKSLLDNPLCHLFKTNKLVETSAPTGTDSDITFTRASTATYVDRYGIVKTATVNTIREEKDGFLIEQAGTNLVPYSEQFDRAVWNKSSVTVTANTYTSPDGTVTADAINTTANNGYTNGIIAISNDTNYYTISIFLKQGTAPVTTVGAFCAGGGGTLVENRFTFDWATFSTLNGSGSIKIINDEWIRVEVQIQNNNSGNTSLFLRLYPAGQSAASGSVIAWGAQLEQSLAATSYIPTVATPVTRLVDKALLPVLNNVVTKEFSIFGIISNKSDSTGGNKIIFRMPVASGFFTLFYTPSNSNFIFRYYGNSTPLEFGAISTENTVYFAITVDESNVTININGTESSATKLSDPSLLLANNVAFFGTTGSALSNGNIKDFRIYDFALNTNEIEYLLP